MLPIFPPAIRHIVMESFGTLIDVKTWNHLQRHLCQM
jgi:hypothetical protein